MYSPNSREAESFVNAVKELMTREGVQGKVDAGARPLHDDQVEKSCMFQKDCVLELKVVSYLKRPLTHFVSYVRKRPIKLSDRVTSAARQDVDNLAKFVLDCLMDLVYADDKQVVALQCIKLYDDTEGALGKTDVTVRVLSEAQVLELLL